MTLKKGGTLEARKSGHSFSAIVGFKDKYANNGACIFHQ
jgi:hypothetical protein